MAADINSLFGSLAHYGVMGIIGIVIGVIVIILIFLGIFMFMRNRKWNLKVEFKMARSDGVITIPEWGKGKYDAINGVIYLKRKRKKAEAVKVKRLDKYLQGFNIITAIGNTGAWRLVIPETFLEVTDDESGETAAFVKLKTDTKEDKSWSVNFERQALNTFTIQSWMAEYGQFLGWAFVILITIISNFIGFSLVLQKIKG